MKILLITVFLLQFLYVLEINALEEDFNKPAKPIINPEHKGEFTIPKNEDFIETNPFEDLEKKDDKKNLVKEIKTEDEKKDAKIKPRSLIKQETDFFDLSKDEFVVEDTDLKKKQKDGAIIIKKTDLKKESKEETFVDKVKKKLKKIKKILPVAKEEKKIEKLEKILATPKKKKTKKDEILEIKIIARKEIYLPHLNYSTINQLSYGDNNKHLTKVRFVEEDYQFLFAAIDQANFPAIIAYSKRLDGSYNLYSGADTPLTYAIKQGDVNVVRKLLALGYPVNQKNRNNIAPIHLSVVLNRKDILTELVRYGANLSTIDRNNKVAIAIARELKLKPIISLLRRLERQQRKTHQTEFDYFVEHN